MSLLTNNGLLYSANLGNGLLYNWHAVNTGKLLYGWRVPTDIELTALVTYLGGDSVAGGKLKETGTKHWIDPNVGATNEVLFTGLGSGFRSDADGSFNVIKEYGGMWSSNEGSPSTSGIARWLYNANATTWKGSYPKNQGLSVRCYRPKASFGALYNGYVAKGTFGNIAPAGTRVATKTDLDLLKTYTSGLMNLLKDTKNWTSTGDNTYGFTLLPSGNRGGGNGLFSNLVSSGGIWSSTPSGASMYAYVYNATNGIVSSDDINNGYSIRCILTDPASDVGYINDTVNGDVYQTVRVGTQVWLAQNLRATKFNNGSSINNVTDNTAWTLLSDAAYCWWNNSEPTASNPSTVTDKNGHIYDVVNINGQLWTKQNLKATKYTDNTNIPNLTDNTDWITTSSGAYCAYDNKLTNV